MTVWLVMNYHSCFEGYRNIFVYRNYMDAIEARQRLERIDRQDTDNWSRYEVREFVVRESYDEVVA